MINRAKRFSPTKTTFQEEKLGDLYCILQIGSSRKTKTKIIKVRKTVKLWTLSSIATLEARKTESGIKTICYKHEKK